MSIVSREKNNVLILVSCQTLYIVAAITVMTLSGVVGHQMSPNPAVATLPIGLMMLGTVVSTLPASLYMAKVGRRHGFISGALVGGIGGGLLSFAGIALNQFWLFCIGNLLLGLYQGFAMYYRFAAIDVASESFRSRAISWVMTGGVVAAFLGPWNASAPVNLIESVPMGGPYLLVALQTVIVIGLLSQLKVPATGEPQPGSYARPMSTIIKQPSLVLAVIAASVGYAIMILVMSATPLAMQDAGFDMGQISYIMQCHVLGMFIPSFFTGTLIARFGTGNVLLVGSVLLIVSALVANSGHSLIQFQISLVLLGVGWNFLFVGGSTLLSTTHVESERGKVQGVNDLIIFTLAAFGSLMAGQLLYWLGWETLNLIMMPFILLVVLMTTWWTIVQRRFSYQG